MRVNIIIPMDDIPYMSVYEYLTRQFEFIDPGFVVVSAVQYYIDTVRRNGAYDNLEASIEQYYEDLLSYDMRANSLFREIASHIADVSTYIARQDHFYNVDNMLSKRDNEIIATRGGVKPYMIHFTLEVTTI